MKCSQAAEKATKIMDNVLEALTSVYLVVGVNRLIIWILDKNKFWVCIIFPASRS